jgi:endonuclease/exonuclease/phosphatase (EEP) superfamily protein YafD
MHNSFKVLPLVDNTLSSLCLVYKLISYSRKLQDDILELIEKDISKYSNDGKIILEGDLNARTGTHTLYFILAI